MFSKAFSKVFLGVFEAFFGVVEACVVYMEE